MDATSELRVARTVARVLDDLYLDPIIGFVLPGGGDVLTGVAGLYLVVLAARLRLPKVTIARMLLNLAVDVGVGMIPVVGDLFDVAWKSNKKNLALLEKRSEAPGRSGPGDWFVVVGAALLLLAALAAPVALLVYALRRIFS